MLVLLFHIQSWVVLLEGGLFDVSPDPRESSHSSSLGSQQQVRQVHIFDSNELALSPLVP